LRKGKHHAARGQAKLGQAKLPDHARIRDHARINVEVSKDPSGGKIRQGHASKFMTASSQKRVHMDLSSSHDLVGWHGKALQGMPGQALAGSPQRTKDHFSFEEI
jgi:hypothetical protein